MDWMGENLISNDCCIDMDRCSKTPPDEIVSKSPRENNVSLGQLIDLAAKAAIAAWKFRLTAPRIIPATPED
jgi:hypothetical protein